MAGLRLREITLHAIGAALPASRPLAGQAMVMLAQLSSHSLIGYPSNRGVATTGIIQSAFIQQS